MFNYFILLCQLQVLGDEKQLLLEQVDDGLRYLDIYVHYYYYSNTIKRSIVGRTHLECDLIIIQINDDLVGDLDILQHLSIS